MSRMTIRAVVFDVGETLVDETRAWGVWADWLRVPRLTFFAALGATIARGGHHREVFELFRPGIDLRAEAVRLDVAGRSDLLSLDDLYPDVIPALESLRAAGVRLAIAGNQPAPAAEVLDEIAIPFEFIGTSAAWGVEKPHPAFFDRIVAELRLPPSQIAYVGDRRDNDVAPAARAGLAAIWIRRGPWGWLEDGGSTPAEAAAVIASLAELPDVLARLRTNDQLQALEPRRDRAAKERSPAG
jgi:FMN phosphatase YigB (HAD superfamily)